MADKIDPIDDTYMLSELAAQITNKITQAIAVMTSTQLKDDDLSDGSRFLPRFDFKERVEVDSDSLRRHKAAAASIFGRR